MTTLQPNQLCDLVNYLLQIPPHRRIEVFVLKTWVQMKSGTGYWRVHQWAEQELVNAELLPRRPGRYHGRRPIRIPCEVQRFVR
jgi:hypothetical protein